jgi:ADP-heptose:LPS heptosyltransferase
LIHTDCRFYKGDIPCHPHKQHGVHCNGCSFYDKVLQRILIIKLGAVGDVIRTTPLLRKLKQVYPQSEISWLTCTPEVLPSVVDRKVRYDWMNVMALKGFYFDILVNLDKDEDACALAKMIDAQVKKGYILQNNKPGPATPETNAKWFTGLFDDINRANTKSYPQEIYDICGYQFSGEQYLIDTPACSSPWIPPVGKKVVGLNTGCGSRWQTRLWPDEHWIELARRLRNSGLEVVLLGGEQEHERNQIIAYQSGAVYPGHFSLKLFMALVGQCDLVVTAVTMCLHVAIGLGKKVVLFNNVFNRLEFELYGRGVTIEPEVPCKGCYKPSYDNLCPAHCMELIKVADVERHCLTLLEETT